MSYSQKIKNLLHNMKNNDLYINNQKINNISRNCPIYKTNIPLIIEESDFNNKKPLPYKNYKNKYQTSNEKDKEILNYMPLNNNENYKNNKRYKYNNNFIIETNAESNRLNNKNINTINSSKNNYNFIRINNKNNNYFNYNNFSDEKNLLFHKIGHTNINNPNNCNIYFSYHKPKNLNNSDNEIQNNYIKEINNQKYLFRPLREHNKKKKLSSYILKDINNEVIILENNIPFYNSSSNYRKKFKRNPKTYSENYSTDINNASKNISSRMMKRQPGKSLSDLFNEEKYLNKNVFPNLKDKAKNKYLKDKLLKIERGYNIFYDNENKNNLFKRSYNSSENIREKKENNSGNKNKIILDLDRNSSKRGIIKKSKNLNYYIILLQSFWRGYILRKLIKITKELFLLFVPFIKRIKKIFNKYKKFYFIYFNNKINQFFTKKNTINKIIPINNRLKNQDIYNKAKNNSNIKSKKFLKKNITSSSLLNKNMHINKNFENNKTKDNTKINDIKQLKINNIFYKKKNLSNNRNESNKILIDSKNLKLSDSSIKNKKHNNIWSVKRFIKRTSYKKFSYISPERGNTEMKANNSSKYLLNDNKNILNNYSSSLSIFNPTHPEIRLSSIKNLVYINKNKKSKKNININIKSDMLEKIKVKIFNNFYLTLYKCIKKSIYRFHWNQLLYKLKQNSNILLNIEEKRRKLKLIILNNLKQIKKHYFRKYRENVLIEKIKTKLFYLTDYSSNKYPIFNSKYSSIKNNLINKTKKLLDIYIKYKINNFIKKYFSIWKMHNNYNFIKIDFPLSSSRGRYIKHKIQNYSGKLNILNSNSKKSKNQNEQQMPIYKKNYNYKIQNECSPVKKNMTKSQSYAENFFSYNNKINNLRYSKKKINNPNNKINNNNQFTNIYYYSESKFSSFNKVKNIFDKINNKNLKYKCFNKWKKKCKIIKK